MGARPMMRRCLGGWQGLVAIAHRCRAPADEPPALVHGDATVKVLITGGAGYLGSIIATALEARGHVPVILDSLYRGSNRFILGRHFYQADIGDGDALQRIFHEHPDLSCTIHCAGLTSVPESMSNPAAYWRENLAKSLALFASLVAVGRPDVVFSSTAAVYAPTANFEVRETDPLKPASPYASSKLAVEMALGDLTLGSPLRTIVLRYFNPIGSDPEYRTGNYDPVSSHVLGQLIAAALGKIDVFTLTGTDLPTRDGTGMRDYIHAWDLAQAHVRAVETFDQVLDERRPLLSSHEPWHWHRDDGSRVDCGVREGLWPPGPGQGSCRATG